MIHTLQYRLPHNAWSTGFLAIIVSIPLFLYPRFVPGSRTVRAHNVSVVTNSDTEINSLAGM